MKHSLKPAVFLILFLILPLCSFAGLNDNIIQNSEWAGDIKIYYFTDSYPQISEVDEADLLELPAENFLPWTLKRRVSGFALTGSGLVIGVNAGYPMLMPLNDDNTPVFI